MSSGSTSTTGPGRPFMRVANARATYSGMRSGSSMRSTRLAMPLVLGPKKLVYSTSWKASRSRWSLATSPTNSTMGVESWNAVCTPIDALVAPGPRVTKHTPGRRSACRAPRPCRPRRPPAG
jgi:hypothetical protein